MPTPVVKTYSFLDVAATLVGPGGVISLGAGAANAEEGITIELTEPKNTMTIGADGSVIHSLHASRAGKVTVRLLKNSPTNSLLSQLYNFQEASSLNWGQNTISLGSIVAGDSYTCQKCAFTRQPTNTYGKEANILDWEFDSGQIDAILASLV